MMVQFFFLFAPTVVLVAVVLMKSLQRRRHSLEDLHIEQPDQV
jgi:hypothetical protein